MFVNVPGTGGGTSAVDEFDDANVGLLELSHLAFRTRHSHPAAAVTVLLSARRGDGMPVPLIQLSASRKGN